MGADVTRIIGIDFGTSTSVVCVKRYKDGSPVGDAFSSSSVTFGNGQGDTRAHTLVRRNGDGTYTCGREAGDEAPGSEVFREFKMDLESPDEAKRTQARGLTEEFFKYLYRWYDHQRSDMGGAGDKEKTIVSFPAKWSEGTRTFMAEAAKKAGFPDVSVMDEPSAALYATLTRKMNDVSANGFLRTGKPGYMLLIDMGAGTTDLAVCRYTVTAGSGDVIRAEQIKNELVATWPESADAPTFGGREVDRLLEDYLTDYMISCGLAGDMARQLVCRADSVKAWKEDTVSARLNDGAVVDSCGFLAGYMMLLPQRQPFPGIDRAKLEDMLGEKLDGFKSLVTGCLDKACALEPAIRERGLDLVVLTGGHSAWYFTEALLNGVMPGVSHPALRRVQAEKARVMRLSNPQETVALGLVYSQLPMRLTKEEEPQPKEEPMPEEKPQPKAEQPVGEQPAAREVPSHDEMKRLAMKFFRHWIMEPDHPSPWTISGPDPSAIRWKDDDRQYTLSAAEDGVHIHNMNGSSKQWRRAVSWEDLLASYPVCFGLDELGETRISLSEGKGEGPCLASWPINDVVLHLQVFFVKLRAALKKRPAAYIWDDRLLPEVKAFFKDIETEKDWMRTLRRRLDIPQKARIYQAQTTAIFKSNLGKTGWAITDLGLFSRPTMSSPYYIPWRAFLNGTLLGKEHSITLLDPHGKKVEFESSVDQKQTNTMLFLRIQERLQDASLALMTETSHIQQLR